MSRTNCEIPVLQHISEIITDSRPTNKTRTQVTVNIQHEQRLSHRSSDSTHPDASWKLTFNFLAEPINSTNT